MKKFSSLLLRVLAVSVIVLSAWSCSKEEARPSANAVTGYTDDELLGTSLLAGEQLVSDVTPGLYRIKKFIDTGDDETAQFNGYKFRFKANGDLIATTNTGQVFKGKWDLNSQETRMELEIDGTEALEDLDDDDWRVKILTDQRIRISAPDPDIVLFVKIN